MGQSNGNHGEARHVARQAVFNFNPFDGLCYRACDPLLGATDVPGSESTLRCGRHLSAARDTGRTRQFRSRAHPVMPGKAEACGRSSTPRDKSGPRPPGANPCTWAELLRYVVDWGLVVFSETGGTSSERAQMLFQFVRLHLCLSRRRRLRRSWPASAAPSRAMRKRFCRPSDTAAPKPDLGRGKARAPECAVKLSGMAKCPVRARRASPSSQVRMRYEGRAVTVGGDAGEEALRSEHARGFG